MCSPSTSGSATTAVQPREVLPKTLTPTHYDLRLTPDLDKFVSDGVVAISVRVNETTDTIVLNAADIEIHSVQVVAADAAKTKTKTKLDINVAANKDAIKYDTAVQTASIKLPIALEAGTEAKIVIAFQNIINDQMNGFYRGYYTDPDGVRKVIVSTQFEATSARLALPCWDEPALKATFDVTLVVPAHLTALSNMHSISEKILENSETKEVKFATTPVMSTYLLAFAVGELEYIEAVADAGYGQNIVHRVYTTKGLKEQGRFALEVSVKALAFFARCFGFDMAKIMSKMDHVALPEFEMGAMENWGLITYRSVRLLVDPKSSGTRSKMLVAEVVCHELAHQWFGNLTSPDWWMYLWLNEGFATWAASLAVDHVFPEWKIWDQFVTDDLGRALQLDSLRSSHPIQVDVVRAADISQIFDAISYAKGCAVIRMLVAHLTLDKFLDGLKTYFQRHKFGNAATDDLWSALSDASGIDVKTFMDLWTLKVGHPLLTVEEVPAGDKLQLHISQHRYLSTNDVKPDEDETLWWVSLDVIVDGEPAPRKVVLTERKTVVDVPASARFYKLNADTTGIYRVRYPASAIPKLGVAISSGALTVGDRAGIVADMAALAESGHISTTDFLDVLRYFANEQSEVVLREIATRLNHIISIFYESPEIVDGLLALRTRLFKNHVERLGWEVPAGGEKIQDTLLRVLAVGQVATAGNHATVLDEAKRRFSQFFASGPSARDEVAIDPSLRPHILSAVVRHTEDAEAYDHVLAYARDESVVADQSTQALAALGATRNPQLIERLLRESLDSEVIRSQDIVRAWQGLAANHEGRRPLWQLVKREWPAIYERFKHSMNYLGLLAKTGIQNLASSKDADEIEAYFASQKSDKASMSIKQSIEKVRVNAAQVQRDHAKVFDWIKRQ